MNCTYLRTGLLVGLFGLLCGCGMPSSHWQNYTPGSPVGRRLNIPVKVSAEPVVDTRYGMSDALSKGLLLMVPLVPYTTATYPLAYDTEASGLFTTPGGAWRIGSTHLVHRISGDLHIFARRTFAQPAEGRTQREVLLLQARLQKATATERVTAYCLGIFGVPLAFFLPTPETGETYHLVMTLSLKDGEGTEVWSYTVDERRERRWRSALWWGGDEAGPGEFRRLLWRGLAKARRALIEEEAWAGRRRPQPDSPSVKSRGMSSSS